MLLSSLKHDLGAYLLIIYTVVPLLSAAVLYYIFFFKPYAKFPAWRLEIRLPYWLINRRKVESVIVKKLIEQARKHEAEGLFVQWFFRPIVFVYGEENVKSVIPYATEKSPLIKVYGFIFGDGIFTSNGDRWKKLRKICSPAFFSGALKGYVPFMNNNGRALVRKLSDSKGNTIEDISLVLAEYVNNLSYEAGLGVKKEDACEGETLPVLMRKITEFAVSRLFRPWLLFDFLLPLFPYARRMLKLEAGNLKTTIEILKQVKQSILVRDQSQVIDEDSLSKRPKSISENILEGFPSMSIDELGKQINEFALAAFEATAHTLMWTFFTLGLNLEIQERLYNEIANLEGDIQYADVQELTYLDCVVKEIARIYTPPFIARRVKEDVQCGNYVIPKNTDVTLFPFMLHRNPEIYPDPEKFDPERFMDKNSKIRPWNYIPFAEGPRTCLGKNFGLLAIKIFLVHVLRDFKVISLDRKEDLTFKWCLILEAEKDPRMRFIPRH